MWRTLSVCILFVFLSLRAADASREKTQETDADQRPGMEQVVVPPFDLPEDDIRLIKERIRRVKPLLEKDRELARMRVRDVEEIPGVVPRVNLAYGYGTVINLPYAFSSDNIVIGAREKFSIETKSGSLIIFPVKEFKSTNIIVFEEKDGALLPHHYLLVEDSASGGADLTVNVIKPACGAVMDMTDAMVRVITTRRLPEKGSAEGIFLEGRSPSLADLTEYPFMRVMRLSRPDLYVYMIAQRVTPVGENEFCVYIDAGTTVVASRTPGITVRRVEDGRTFTKAR